jgi:hypothetical protein
MHTAEIIISYRIIPLNNILHFLNGSNRVIVNPAALNESGVGESTLL